MSKLKMSVYSGNDLGFRFKALAMSLTQRVNKGGPRTDPCRTPLVTVPLDDCFLLSYAGRGKWESIWCRCQTW